MINYCVKQKWQFKFTVEAFVYEQENLNISYISTLIVIFLKNKFHVNHIMVHEQYEETEYTFIFFLFLRDFMRNIPFQSLNIFLSLWYKHISQINTEPNKLNTLVVVVLLCKREY